MTRFLVSWYQYREFKTEILIRQFRKPSDYINSQSPTNSGLNLQLDIMSLEKSCLTSDDDDDKYQQLVRSMHRGESLVKCCPSILSAEHKDSAADVDVDVDVAVAVDNIYQKCLYEKWSILNGSNYIQRNTLTNGVNVLGLVNDVVSSLLSMRMLVFMARIMLSFRQQQNAATKVNK